ncbi:MAG: hypothetical protein MUF04_13220 [Akkermansiaceae bacterium]|nr:hypothetical protein [Akkermansiaceae bacterium]
MGSSAPANPRHYPDSRPWTRWWWFANPIRFEQLASQLVWLRDMGFGGVEIAWVYPHPDEEPGGAKWLSPEWSELVAFASQHAASLGLGCDFTFGTLWPFGGTFVSEADASLNYDGPSPQRLRKSWESPAEGRILNHLDAGALERYAAVMGAALAPALTRGRRPGFFCDSWEVRTEGLWAAGFGDAFRARFGYDIEPLMPVLDDHPDARYDYRKLIGEYVLREFYEPYAVECQRHGGFARVQCHGAPTDLLAAYAAAEVPESEALLFDPGFSQIAASAALLGGRPIVSAEAFTCLYGWRRWPGPGQFQGEERIGDIYLLGDALVANGVNHLIWHGTPLLAAAATPERQCQRRFYASVHVGPDAAFAGELAECNRYFTEICAAMREGRPYTDVAVYLPLEDRRMLGGLPEESRKPSGEYHWELHDLRFPSELAGYQPTWVSEHFLREAEFRDGILHCGDAEFTSLYLDCEWLDGDALAAVARLALLGLPVCLKRHPRQPGSVRSPDFARALAELHRSGRVADRFAEVAAGPPLLAGPHLPPHRCRVVDGDLVVFFAHPHAAALIYPMRPGQFEAAGPMEVPVTIRWQGVAREILLSFAPGRGVLLRMTRGGALELTSYPGSAAPQSSPPEPALERA